MSELLDPLEGLIRALTRLPGVGPRSAQRIAYHLARAQAAEVRQLGESIASLPDTLRRCAACGHLAAAERCVICEDPRRDQSVICVVEQSDNLAAIERAGVYRGLYHVLGGAISPLRQVGPGDLSIRELFERVEAGEVHELILATNPTVEGEATALYIARQASELPLRVTRPATGLPVGGELDYVDKSTLARALEGRRTLDDD